MNGVVEQSAYSIAPKVPDRGHGTHGQTAESGHRKTVTPAPSSIETLLLLPVTPSRHVAPSGHLHAEALAPDRSSTGVLAA
jgi:hypothetical protein